MPYMKSKCVAGKTIEYEYYYTYRADAKGGVRRKKANRTPEAQQKVNRRMAEKKLTRIMNENFSGEDYYITFSYRKEERPSKEGLKRDIRKLLNGMRKKWRGERKELKYIWAAEVGERGVVHIHMVVNSAENMSKYIRELWGKGWICIKPLDKSGQYRKLAEYFVKYSAKTMKTDEGYIKKSYCSSKNLIIPEPKKRKIKARNRYNHTIEIPVGYYIDKESIKEAWHEVTGYMYFTYTLVKGEKTKEEEIVVQTETGEIKVKERW